MPSKQVAFFLIFCDGHYTATKCGLFGQAGTHTGTAPCVSDGPPSSGIMVFVICHFASYHLRKRHPDVVMLSVLSSVPEIANYMK